MEINLIYKSHRIGNYTVTFPAFMALLTKLQFGDNAIRKYSKEYTLEKIEIHFIRETDTFGPCGDTLCNSLSISVVGEAGEDNFLYQWYISGENYSGRILLESIDIEDKNGSVIKEILFDDAQCYELNEEFKLDEERRTVSLALTTSKLSISDLEFKK